MKNDIIYLTHMLKRCQKIRSIMSEVTKEQFISDENLQDIVIRSLEILGEATANISDELKHQHQEVPWIDVKNFRNQMIHQYFRVDLSIVFDVAVSDIPVLEKQITNILSSLENE